MVYELKRKYYSFIFKLPLRKCTCGDAPYLRSYLRKDSRIWCVECDHYSCGRFITRTYDNPLKAIVMWNIKNYKKFD